MHVGMAAIFQNPGRHTSDREVWQQDLRLADMAEPLGFDSIWSVEHHFTDYTMCPNPVQFLTYMAGRTERVQLGSMVVVLPWHDPIRIAEEISTLDHVSDGRYILGIGRGSGRVEFDGFGVPMDESRDRFIEVAECVLTGLEQGYCELDGQFVHQARRDIRPAPFRSFKGRTYAAVISPESSRIMAELGIGMLIIPQKPWKDVTAELDEYRRIYQAVNGEPAPPTISAGWVYCDEDADRAAEGAYRWIGAYYQSVMDHYEFHTGHLKGTKGYEFYAKMADHLADDAGKERAIRYFMDLQVYGTPEQCVEKITHTTGLLGADSFIGVFSYAGMPWDEAERNMALFAAEVRPHLQARPALEAPVAVGATTT